MKESEPITKYMATKLITFTPDVDIEAAIRIMLKNKISGAPVLSEEGNLVGMLSEKDCIRVIMEGPYRNQPGSTGTVGDFMSTDVTTIDKDKTIMDAAYVFTHEAFRRLPVVENGKLIGQISRRDILSAILNIRPQIHIVPDSWRGREPIVDPSKQGRYNKNA